MSKLFKKARKHFNLKLPFVVYCKPNSDKIISLFQTIETLFELDSTNESGFVMVSFDNKKQFIIPENQSEIIIENTIALDLPYSSNAEVSFDKKDKISFEKLVKSGVEAICIKQFEKVVLSRKEIVKIENFDFELVFSKLILNYNEALKYCFYHPKIGFWIGATPEQFVKIEDTKLKTVSLAGTQLNSDDEPVVWHKKEIKEQQIVTDYIVNNLELFSNKIEFSKPYTIKAGTLSHIKTTIEAEILDKNSIYKIINVLHPTPAVCGFPKQNAKNFILENENYDREFYSGFLGEWKKDFLTNTENQSDLFVNLRCMKVEDNQAIVYIGCGITKDSIPEKEFEETVNKSMTMKKVL